MDYRVYKLNPAGRIVKGDWIEAVDDAAAVAIAHALCDVATPAVELWRGSTLLGVFPCDEDAAA